MLSFAMAVKLDSREPALFSQLRADAMVGPSASQVRTMCQDAEQRIRMGSVDE